MLTKKTNSNSHSLANISSIAFIVDESFLYNLSNIDPFFVFFTKLTSLYIKIKQNFVQT